MQARSGRKLLDFFIGSQCLRKSQMRTLLGVLDLAVREVQIVPNTCKCSRTEMFK